MNKQVENTDLFNAFSSIINEIAAGKAFERAIAKYLLQDNNAYLFASSSHLFKTAIKKVEYDTYYLSLLSLLILGLKADEKITIRMAKQLLRVIKEQERRDAEREGLWETYNHRINILVASLSSSIGLLLGAHIKFWGLFMGRPMQYLDMILILLSTLIPLIYGTAILTVITNIKMAKNEYREILSKLLLSLLTAALSFLIVILLL